MPDSTITLRTRADLAALAKAQNEFDKLNRQFQQLQTSEIKAAVATQQYDRAMRLVTSEMVAAGEGTTRYNQLLIQQVQIQKQAERAALAQAQAQRRQADDLRAALQPQAFTRIADEAKRTASSIDSIGTAAGGLKEAFGAIGIGFGVKQLIDFGISSGQAAIALRETENSLKAVSGSAENYAEAISIAKQQQLLFGGTLQENIEGIAGLTITARQSGASLKTLVDLSQRLSVLSPEQGAIGGRIALAEALSGNLTSLSKRFEIPKAALKGLQDESLTTEQRLKNLSDFLDSVGVSSETVAGRVDKSALAFRKLGAEADEAKRKIGGVLADVGAPVASGTSGFLASTSAFFSGDFKKSAADAREGIRGFIEGMRRGGPVAQAFGQFIETLTGVQEKNTQVTFRVADADDRAADAAFVHSQFVFRAADADDRIAASAQTAVAQMDRFIASLQASADASIVDTAKKDAQQATTALVADKARLAADQFLALNPLIDASAAASLAAAQGYDPEIQKLITLAIVARDAAAARQALNNGGPQGTVEDRKERNTPEQLAQAGAAGAKLVRDQADAAEQARQNQIIQTGTALQKVRVLQEQYNEAVKQYGKNSAQAIDAQTRLIEAQQDAAKPKGGRSVGGKGLSTLDRTDIALAGDESARLAEINRRLAAGNLTELQRKQLLKEKLDLEEKIKDTILKQNEAIVDAQLLTVRNQQERIKEDRELAAIARRRASPEFSAEQKNLDALREQEIVLERQKREIDIQDKSRAAGGVVPVVPSSGPVAAAAGGAPAAIPVSSPTPPNAGQQKVGVFLDGKEVGFVLFPEFMAFLQGGAAQVRAAGG